MHKVQEAPPHTRRSHLTLCMQPCPPITLPWGAYGKWFNSGSSYPTSCAGTGRPAKGRANPISSIWKHSRDPITSTPPLLSPRPPHCHSFPARLPAPVSVLRPLPCAKPQRLPISYKVKANVSEQRKQTPQLGPSTGPLSAPGLCWPPVWLHFYPTAG